MPLIYSLLLKLYKEKPEIIGEKKADFNCKKTEIDFNIQSFEMSEDNVYLIDMCSFSLDGSETVVPLVPLNLMRHVLRFRLPLTEITFDDVQT